MNVLYQIVLFLFILGAVTQGFNEYNVFGVALPNTGLTLESDRAESLHQGALKQPTSEFNWVEVLRTFMSVIGAGVLAVFTIIPLAIKYGVPLGLAIILQAPVTLVTIFGLWEWWMGRSVE